MKYFNWLSIGLVVLCLSMVSLAGCVSETGVPESEYKALENENMTLVKENASLRAGLEDLQADFDMLKAESETGVPESEYKALEDENMTLVKENASLRAGLEDLQADFDTLKAEYDAVSQELAELKEVTPTPTPEEPATPEPTVEEPSIITSKADLQKFLEENYAALNTSLGPTDFTFCILENTSITSPYDYWIAVDYDFSFFYDLKYSNKITTEMNHKVCEELKTHQESLAKAIIQKMPDIKFYGGYHYSWYTYPNIKVDLNVRRYYSWVNYEPASILTSYDEAKISDFTWYPLIDDELVR